MTIDPPFSSTERGAKAWIQNSLPDTSRSALLHLLYDLVDKKYVSSWIDIDKELTRIARVPPKRYQRDRVDHENEARKSAESLIQRIEWVRAFDFCERLFSNLAIAVSEWVDINNQEIVLTREQVQSYISDEIERILLEENLGYSFVHGKVQRKGRSHTRNRVGRVEPTLGDSRLNSARGHFSKALRFFDHATDPDFENAVKEAVCAVEAAARSLFPESKGKTLGEIAKDIAGSQTGQLPKPLADSIVGIYGYRNAGEGVSHGGAKGGRVTRGIAEYVIATAASQIILLHEVSEEAKDELPF